MSRFGGMSVLHKIMLPVSILMIFAMVTLAFSIHQKNSSILRKQGIKELTALSGEYGNQVKAYIEVGLDEVHALAQSIKGLKDKNIPLDRDEVKTMLGSIIKGNNMFIGGSTGWEPNAFDGKDNIFANTKGYNASGRFLPYIYKDDGHLRYDILEGYDVPVEGDYYLVPKARGKSYVVPPYLYRVGSQMILMTSTCAPVMVGGKFQGVFCLDIPLSRLSKKINTIKPYGTGFAFLMTGAGQIVAHPNQDNVGKFFSEIYTDKKVIKNVSEAISQGKAYLSLQENELTGENMLIRFAPISFRDTGQQWYIAVCVPVTAMEAAAKEMSMTVIYQSIGAIAIVLIALFFIARSISTPIVQMAAWAHKISSGDYSARIDDSIIGGELRELCTALQDMVKQVELREKILLESEKKYRNLVESSTDIIFHLSPTGKISFMNSKYEFWTGFSVNDIIGQPFETLFSDKHRIESTKAFQDGINDKKIDLYGIDFVTSSGGTVPMELNLVIQHDSQGYPEGAIGIARDITKRLSTEQELKKYEQITASSTDLMWLIDQNGIVQATNDAVVVGIDIERSKLVGSHVKDHFGEEIYTNIIIPRMKTCDQGKSAKFKGWVTYPDSFPRYMDISFYPSTESNTDISGVVINERDITEQKKLEMQLQQAQKMEAIGTLAGGIAHDFNNILGGIIGYAEMIEMFDEPKDSPTHKKVKHILKGANRAKELVEQILTFSRRTDQNHKALRLGPLIKETLKFLRASIPSTINIKEDINCPDCVVETNATQMHQILLNICANAAYAMQAHGGELKVTLVETFLTATQAKAINLETGSYAKIAISDTGEGIDPDIANRILDPFFTTKPTGAGTGMGLAVVHGIVKSHGGTVTFTSKLGKGTTFEILLPTSYLDVEEEVKDSELPSAGKARILFVDDEEELVHLNKDLLSLLGYEVTAEQNSLKAKEMFLTNPDSFDLLITDQTMPEMTGCDLAEELLKVKPDLPIILCTGHISPELINKAEKIGKIHLLKKPAGVRDLAKAITDVVKA